MIMEGSKGRWIRTFQWYERLRDVIKDEAGRWLFEFNSKFSAVPSVMAELIAIIQGLNLCWSKGYRNVVYSDCLEATDFRTKGTDCNYLFIDLVDVRVFGTLKGIDSSFHIFYSSTLNTDVVRFSDSIDNKIVIATYSNSILSSALSSKFQPQTILISLMEDAPSSSSPSTSQLQAEEANPDSDNSNEQNHQPLHSLFYRVDISMANPHLASIRDDVWSCLIILVTLWLVATMGLVLGIYGTTTLELGPYSSVLVQVNSMFVQSIKVEQIDEPKHGIMLYGLDEAPALDDLKTNWSGSYNGSVPHNFYKEWIFYLNKQSQLDIFYNVKSPRFSHLSLVIAQGREELYGWIEKPTFPNRTLYWNIIYGKNKISQKISDPFSYYVGLGNLNSEDVEVELKFSVRSVQYNTSSASSRCSPDSSLCRLDLYLSQPGSLVLTTPPPSQGNFEEEWFHVKLSYAPRWITYFVASGMMTALIFLLLRCCNVFQRYGSSNMESFQQVRVVSERAPLLASIRNDGVSSLGSSYESFTSEEEDLTEWLKGKPLMKEGEGDNNSMKHLCVICFDASRDCFFLPCGHSAACFHCGTRVVDEASPCPICRRKIKKVRKIFTV
ncbi:uncharacterized protein LOC114712656 [Neltuma alba]|uniref:uncharacterized protein LOC114712656 n=1 Tax=Neltuma alba TaxID=207710 RepID=UPI0010A42C22|nr:uncharacterized protein LOC114712656 [Prosopis alba]